MSPFSAGGACAGSGPAKRVVMIGSGGHARVLAAALRTLGISFAAVAASGPATCSDTIFGGTVTVSDEEIMAGRHPDLLLVNGVGGVEVMHTRRQVYARFCAAGRAFMTVVHPAACVADDADVDVGAQVMAGAIVQSGARIGHNAIVNSRAVVEHDCRVGEHAHVATGAVLAGDVQVGAASLIGAGAVVRQGVRIGAEALIAAGAVVVCDIPDRGRVAGVPARPMKSGAHER